MLDASTFQPAVVRGAVDDSQKLRWHLSFVEHRSQNRFRECLPWQVLRSFLSLRKAPPTGSGCHEIEIKPTWKCQLFETCNGFPHSRSICKHCFANIMDADGCGWLIFFETMWNKLKQIGTMWSSLIESETFERIWNHWSTLASSPLMHEAKSLAPLMGRRTPSQAQKGSSFGETCVRELPAGGQILKPKERFYQFDANKNNDKSIGFQPCLSSMSWLFMNTLSPWVASSTMTHP